MSDPDRERLRRAPAGVEQVARPLTSSDLRTLIAVRDFGSVSHAARRLHMSQDRLHAELARLCGLTGQVLVRQASGRLFLTVSGTRLVAACDGPGSPGEDGRRGKRRYHCPMPSRKAPAKRADPSTSEPPAAPHRDLDVRRVPRQARSQQTVRAVLKAASDEIQRAGLDHLSTKRIAQAAGLSVGSLYGYFPNKESIVAALLETWLQRVYDAVDSVHPRHGEQRDIFAYLNEQLARALVVYEEQPAIGVLFGMAASVPALHTTIAHHAERTHDSIASALAAYAPNAAAAAVHSAATTIPLMCHYLITTALFDARVDRQCMLADLRTCLVALATRLLLAPAALAA